jgi:hypothetical protein
MGQGRRGVDLKPTDEPWVFRKEVSSLNVPDGQVFPGRKLHAAPTDRAPLRVETLKAVGIDDDDDGKWIRPLVSLGL